MRARPIPLVFALLAACDPEPVDPCSPDATFTGTLAGSNWEGEEVSLGFTAEGRGTWTDGCYGGHIDDDLAVDGTAFDWAAEIYPSGFEGRPVRAVGCVSDRVMELSIVEVDGTPFQGPWRLARTSAAVDLVLCD